MPAFSSTPVQYKPYPGATGQDRPVIALGGVLAAHLAVLGLLLSFNATRPPSPALLMASLIAATPPKPEATPALPASPDHAARVRPAPSPGIRQPQLAARSEAPGSTAEPPPAGETPPTPAKAVAPETKQELKQELNQETAPERPARFDADYLRNPPPAYPALSRRLGEEGKVVLRVFVEPAGHPSQIEVKVSSGSPQLDQAAQNAVWRWRFVAARRGDENIGAWVLVPIVFKLNN